MKAWGNKYIERLANDLKEYGSGYSYDSLKRMDNTNSDLIGELFKETYGFDFINPNYIKIKEAPKNPFKILIPTSPKNHLNNGTY